MSSVDITKPKYCPRVVTADCHTSTNDVEDEQNTDDHHIRYPATIEDSASNMLMSHWIQVFQPI